MLLTSVQNEEKVIIVLKSTFTLIHLKIMLTFFLKFNHIVQQIIEQHIVN